MDRYQQGIEAAYLVRCSPQAAYDWLREHQHRDDMSLWQEETPKVLEYLLVRRKDALIDLGIARFGNSVKAIERVVRRGNIGVRCAALANPRVGPSAGFLRDGWLDSGGVKKLIREGAQAELEALAKNPYLADDAIKDLLERKHAFEELSEAQYLYMLMWLGQNPRLSKPYNDRFLDGLAWYDHNQVFSVAWELARTLPAEPLYAGVLHDLLVGTELPVNYKEPSAVIARWRIEEEREDGESPFANSYLLRSRLADLLKPNDHLIHSDDLALRTSFYRRFDPVDYEDWPMFIERDGEVAYDALVKNDHLWRRKDERERLSRLAWKMPDPNSSMNAPNEYKGAEWRKRREHPEWFPDEGDEQSSDPDAIIGRLEGNISDLKRLLDRLAEHAAGPERRDQRTETQEVTTPSQSARRPEQIVPTWAWIAAILIALIYVLKP